jgi:two-component system sensor histidine kinase AtoS
MILARNHPTIRFRDGMRIEEYFAEVPDAMLSGEKLSQAIFNIVSNAFQAVPADGLIRVETLFLQGEPLPLRVAITNSGSSIDPAQIDRIFEPFFTTKATGSGLGLSIAYQIVTHHGGDIIASNGDNCVTFTVRLPESAVGERSSNGFA